MWASVQGVNKKYFESLGYDIPKYINDKGEEGIKRGTRILVKVEDLSKGSTTIVTKVCDHCGTHVKTTYASIIQSRKKFTKDSCKACSDLIKANLINNELHKTRCVSITHPEFAKLFWNPEDTYSHAHQSNQKVEFKCPICNQNVGQKNIQTVFKYGLSCPRCSDGISYPEKFMRSLLTQLDIKFEVQKTFPWSDGKRYDFYLKDYNTIIETHGSQHYEGKHFRGFEAEQENDNIKMDLAYNNGIKHEEYIVIDSRRSTLAYMERSTKNSTSLSSLLDISKVDFQLCHEEALKSITLIICILYSKEYKIIDISKELGLSRCTIRNHLKQGSEIGLCSYSTNTKKEVVQLNLSGDFLAEYSSITKAAEIVGGRASDIVECCKGKRKSSKGFKWMYKIDYIS